MDYCAVRSERRTVKQFLTCSAFNSIFMKASRVDSFSTFSLIVAAHAVLFPKVIKDNYESIKLMKFSESRHLQSVDYMMDDGDLNRAKKAGNDVTRS